MCARDRACLFGDVVNDEMRLNEAGEIARRCWEDVPHHFPLVELDAFIIMPNHVHGINAARVAPGTPVWQRGYYEHVVRNEAELMAIREYIVGNPACWDDDENNPNLATR